MPIIIWIVIGVCFVYFLLFLAIVIVYTRYVSIIKARTLSTYKLLKLENLSQINNGKGLLNRNVDGNINRNLE